MSLFLSFAIFACSLVGMGIMIYRAFPRLAEVVAVHHKKFSLFGIDNVHILEYKEPTEIARRKLFISLEKLLRRTRGLVLKLDTLLSKAIEAIQRKNTKVVISEVKEEPMLPVKALEVMPLQKNEHNEIVLRRKNENTIVIKEKPKTPLRRGRVVRDIAEAKNPEQRIIVP